MLNRRTLLKLAASGVAFTLVPKSLLAAEPSKGKRYVMVFDVRRCISCMSCTVNCCMENHVSSDRPRTVVNTFIVEGKSGPAVVAVPNQCNHCTEPPCVKVCPVKATFKRPEDGIVVIDYNKCIHCNACVSACPYGARKGDETHKEPPEKCNFCVHRIKEGLLPSCVETCIGRARVFGDLNDPESEVARLVKENEVYILGKEWGTGPNIFYIGLPDINDKEVLQIKSTEWQR